MKQASSTAVGQLNLYKVRLQGEHGCTVGLPKDVCLALGMAPGQSFVTVRAVGPCLVIARATDVASEESKLSEADAQVSEMIAAWLQSRGEKLYRIAPVGDGDKTNYEGAI